MSLRIFRAGLKHSLVDAKWPHFEEVFAGFDPPRVRAMSDEALEALLQDKRVIRHWGKMKAVRANAAAFCELAEEWELPMIMYTEGGGGRPGDTDVATQIAGLNIDSFVTWARLSGQVPRIAINNGEPIVGRAAINAQGGAGQHTWQFVNAAVDQLLAEGGTTLDIAKRKKAYGRIQEIMREELPFLPVFQYSNVRGHKSGLMGYSPNVNVRITTWNAGRWYWA